jgi:hypothetical protein
MRWLRVWVDGRTHRAQTMETDDEEFMWESLAYAKGDEHWTVAIETPTPVVLVDRYGNTHIYVPAT